MHDLLRISAALPPASARNDAVRADAVAAHRDLDPRLVGAFTLHREVPGEALEREVALSPEVVCLEELCHLVDLPRPEGDVDERELLENLFADRLRPAAPHSDDPRGILRLQPLRLAQVSDEPVVRGFADRAGVEEDQVGLVARGHLFVSERVEHALEPLGVVLVHLAAESGDVIALHWPRNVSEEGSVLAGTIPYFA